MKLREKLKAEIKSSIVRASDELFKTKGFNDATIEEITSAAGVARGTFYNYFQTKEDIAFYLVYETEEFTSEQIEEFFVNTPGIDNQIREILRRTVEWTSKRPELVLVTIIEKMKRGNTPNHPNGTFFRRMITKAFEMGQLNGTVKKERNPLELANDLDGLYVVHMVRWYHAGKNYDLLTVLLSAVDTYLLGALINPEQKTHKN